MRKATPEETIDSLRKLQQVDRKLANFARMKEFEPRRLADAQGALAAAEAELRDLGERHEKREHEINRKELDIKARREKVNKLKGQMLQASTNKEYQSFLNEIALEEMERGKIEDELLEMMIDVEAFAKGEASAKAKIAEAHKALDAIGAEVAAALAEIKRDEASVDAERNGVAEKIVPDLLRKYEGLFKSRAGEAVVAAKYEAGSAGNEGRYLCRGCFMPLTHQMVNLLLLGQEMVTCKSCGRILYVEDTEPKG